MSLHANRSGQGVPSRFRHIESSTDFNFNPPMNTQDEYREEYQKLFSFSDQIRACCEMKTNVTIQSNIEIQPDGRTHPFYGLRRDAIKFFIQVEGQYCMITPTVCLMTCSGLIWVTLAMSVPDYEPTRVEAQAIEMAAIEMGCWDLDEIDFHHARVEIVPVDDVDPAKIRKSIHLH